MRTDLKKIAVIGGGPMGLAVAYELTLNGFQPILFEADDRLGGMAACFDFEGLQIERYYHFHCLSDYAFFDLLDEIGIQNELNWKQTKMGFYYNGRLYKWGSLSSVIQFSRVPWISRVRYLFHAARCLTIQNWLHLDKITATKWLKEWLGEKGYQVLWEKLFAYKFYHFSDQISAAWIWSRIRRLGKSRRYLKESLGFLQNGSQQLINEMGNVITSGGGEIKLSTPILGIKPNEESGGILKTERGDESFDLVISTIPLPLVGNIFRASNIDDSIVAIYENLNSVACACVVLKTRCQITENFWTNINDSRFAIPGVIEMSNLRELSSHICYIPFYMPGDHPDYQRPNQSFISDAWDCIKALNPNLNDKDLISAHCSRYRYAQPVCGINFKDKLPPINPFNGVFTLDTTAYYPEDRGISESIGFGRNLVRQILNS
tara:strand:+ start:22753 stop:24051 length:1299 start_codon:yes stop_codon:yes gene_type:complete